MKSTDLAKFRDLMVKLEALKRAIATDYAHGQKGKNENGRIGGKAGITPPGSNGTIEEGALAHVYTQFGVGFEPPAVG